MQFGYNPYGNIASGLNPVTSGIDNSSISGVLADTDSTNTYLGALYNNSSAEDALEWIRINNPELYAQLLVQRDNNRLEWERYKDYQMNYYTYMKDSLEKAGMNPWLALQNFGSLGTGSVASIQGMNSGSSTLQASREANKTTLDAKNSDLLKGLGTGAIALVGTIMALLIAAL